MENMRTDYLYGTSFSIVQEEDGYHFNSDTELLGLFLQARKKEKVLDIGCHSGALMLYALHQGALDVEGIDLFEEVTALAKENLARCEQKGCVHTGRIQDFQGGPYDLIVCNPPYFSSTGTMVPQSTILRAARHETELSLQELFGCVRRLLSDKGRFCIVHRASRFGEVLRLAETNGLHLTRMRPAYKSAGSEASVILVEFRRTSGRETIVEPPAYLNDRSTFILAKRRQGL